MKNTDLLRQYGLSRNPFTDRTAEKTDLDDTSLYVHSDLQHFAPSETTYLFFGRRGSGKTTIRLAMQRAYERHNESVQRGRGHFLVDLCRPGHLTSCLKDFQECIKCTNDNWDAAFVDNWTSADLVDCIYAYAITHIVQCLSAEEQQQKGEAGQMMASLCSDPRIGKQFLVLAHLYARTDAATLVKLRHSLQKWTFTAPQAAASVVCLAGAVTTGTVAITNRRACHEATLSVHAAVERAAPFVADRPLVCAAGFVVVVSSAYWWYRKYARARSLERAAALQSHVRVVKRRPVAEVASLLDAIFTSKDTVDTIRQMHVGISAHQKLEHLSNIVKLIGYESLCVFGDCFDEVTLLDPVQYPGAIKAFAKEVCRNDLLNFGRLHFFFPDSRLSLDLNTDRTLKEARFDRHFVRDLAWSRYQLEELADRRFRAAQEQYPASTSGNGTGKDGGKNSRDTTFSSLFKEVSGEDFASYVSKLQTPRELLIMMTEMFSRIEANPGGQLKAQDMEFAVNKAKEQAV